MVNEWWTHFQQLPSNTFWTLDHPWTHLDAQCIREVLSGAKGLKLLQGRQQGFYLNFVFTMRMVDIRWSKQ